jgi:hypothetical protein
MPADQFEVIVSDDGSSDTTEAVAASFSDRLRIKYTFQEDRGFRAAAARNAGARLGVAPLLVFLDTGSLAGPDFLRSHVAEHGSQAARRAVIGYAYGWHPGDPKIMEGLKEAVTELPPEEVVKRFRDRSAFQDERHQFLQEFDFDLERQAIPWPMFLSLNFSVRAEDFWAVGGFDEGFCGWGFEDLELGYRLFRHGLSFRMTQDAWVIEWPHERNQDANLREAAVNLEWFLSKHQEPTTEILWYALNNTSIWACDSHYRELAAWHAQSGGIDVTGELSAAVKQGVPGSRVAVVGSGGLLPPPLAGATVIDFDKELLGKALAGGGGPGYHAIGLRTPMADQSMDMVLITSRMAGLWDRWGNDLLAEAHRIGRDVRVLGPMR